MTLLLLLRPSKSGDGGVIPPGPTPTPPGFIAGGGGSGRSKRGVRFRESDFSNPYSLKKKLDKAKKREEEILRLDGVISELKLQIRVEEQSRKAAKLVAQYEAAIEQRKLALIALEKLTKELKEKELARTEQEELEFLMFLLDL